MLYHSLIELDMIFSLLIIIIFGLFSLRSQQLYLSHTYLFLRLFPFIWVLYQNGTDFNNLNIQSGIEVLLALCVVGIMPNFSATNSFESSLLVLLAFIFQYYMLHSTDLISFFITLEAQNFCFFVLCGILPFIGSNKHNTSMSIEVGLKYLLLSAFSSGILLYGTSLLYLNTGSVSFPNFLMYLDPTYGVQGNMNTLASYLILCAILFKLGVAPFHLWMYQIYNGTHRTLLLYITTIPKLCIFAFWLTHFQGILSNYTLIGFSLLSGFIGSTAYVQPNIRNLLVYSSISEIGLLVAALETAGYHALWQHLTIYIIGQFLLWNLDSTGTQFNRIMPFLAASLAGLPPLAGFFGKAWIFYHLGTYNAFILLVFTLLFAFVSMVFYLRLIRLSWAPLQGGELKNTSLFNINNPSRMKGTSNNKIQLATLSWNAKLNHRADLVRNRVFLTSTCVVLLIILPLFVMKPFFPITPLL